MLQRYLLLLGLVFLLAIPRLSQATHLRAADIQLTQIQNRQYEITLTVYTDTKGSEFEDLSPICIRSINPFNPDQIQECFEEIEITPPTANTTNEDDTEEFVISVDYTFPSDGTYALTWNQQNRNGGIENLGKNVSDGFSMFIETIINVGGSFPINNSPQLTIPPIDKANVGDLFVHNPGAFDPDGDSLIFELVTPRGTDEGVPINEYSSPSSAEHGGASSFSIDPVTGIITWDTPNVEGTFVIAFSVTEVRDNIILGSVVRDMQIIVKDTSNDPPELILPPDKCIMAGNRLRDTIFGSDPDENDNILISQFGLPKENGALDTMRLIENNLGYLIFDWQTECTDVKEFDYLNSFKIEDNNQYVNLTYSENRNIRVIGPPPTGVSATGQDSTITLNWDTYECSNIEYVSIWRRECEQDFEIDSCTSGVPASWGFTEIGQVPYTQTEFVDTDLGNGLNELINYTYVLSAKFLAPENGESYPSSPVSAAIKIKSPIVYSISADTSALLPPSNTIYWSAPLELNLSASTTVTVTKKTFENFVETSSETIAILTGEESLDSSYTDTNIDPENYYEYAVGYNSSEGSKTSSFNSSVYAEALNTINSLTLEWTTNTAWGGNDSLQNYIWRVEGDSIWLLDSVNSIVTTYEDSSIIVGDTVCYVIETQGVFCHDSLLDISVNYSQKICGVAKDTVPPCPPSVLLNENDCDNFDPLAPIENQPYWIYPSNPSCSDTLIHYLVYEKQDTSYLLLDTLTISDTLYLHTGIDSYAKCYVVTALDAYYNESDYSNIVCNDNCEKIDLPNLISPGLNDGKNDFFNPFPDMRAVEEITFKVYNRWGSLVYESTTDEEINWPGTNMKGEQLNSGIYYYSADITFDKINVQDSFRTIKGWIQIF